MNFPASFSPTPFHGPDTSFENWMCSFLDLEKQHDLPQASTPAIVATRPAATPTRAVTTVAAPQQHQQQQVKLGAYTQQARELRIAKYREKRRELRFGKVRYSLRSQASERRTRIKGRFVKSPRQEDHKQLQAQLPLSPASTSSTSSMGSPSCDDSATSVVVTLPTSTLVPISLCFDEDFYCEFEV